MSADESLISMRRRPFARTLRGEALGAASSVGRGEAVNEISPACSGGGRGEAVNDGPAGPGGRGVGCGEAVGELHAGARSPLGVAW